MKQMVAVLVLYKMRLAESASYLTLSQALRSRPEFAERCDLLVFDNSPEPQPLPPDFVGRYRHDHANPGLARRYNDALAAAVASGCAWLLLLDQDTTLTLDYIDELETLASQWADREQMVAIVPRLVMAGALMSPHAPMYRSSTCAVGPSSEGVIDGLIRVYNSGALVRVRAIQAIGGFPEAYWLDSLDHATFHRMQAQGGRIYLMRSALEHDMATLQPGKHTGQANAARQNNLFAAELRFYREHGSALERRRHRIDLVRKATRAAAKGHLGESGRLLKAALSRAPR